MVMICTWKSVPASAFSLPSPGHKCCNTWHLIKLLGIVSVGKSGLKGRKKKNRSYAVLHMCSQWTFWGLKTVKSAGTWPNKLCPFFFDGLSALGSPVPSQSVPACCMHLPAFSFLLNHSFLSWVRDFFLFLLLYLIADTYSEALHASLPQHSCSQIFFIGYSAIHH